MPVRQVLRHPHPGLKAQARALADDADCTALVADLVATMESFPRCAGIAAPQVGELVRVCVVDCSLHPKCGEHHGRLVLVNPVIVEAEGSEVGREGCLSIPELTANVRRASRVRVRARDLDVDATGFEARVLQHEIDHLDGLLFLDRVTSVARDVFRRRAPR